MKVVIAPDSFKDALRAQEVVRHIIDGFKVGCPGTEFEPFPLSDGGEGFIETVMRGNPKASRESCITIDPLGRKIRASWVMVRGDTPDKSTAMIELASASGLELLKPEERNPCLTSTRGTGMMLREAYIRGARRFVLGIGGSATHDAGLGIAQAIGMIPFDAQGNQIISTQISGGQLIEVRGFDAIFEESGLMTDCEIHVACDVDNPLTGTNGAAHTYAAQKGATPAQIEELEAGTKHIAEVWRKQFGVDVETMPGAGAAGGVGGGLVAMLGAKLTSGAELVLETIGFGDTLNDADLVITGEGRLDSQSLQGKAAMTVAKRCKQAGVPCVALVGSVGEGAEQALDHGLSAYHVIGEGLPVEESIRRTGELLEAAAVKLAQSHRLK